MSALGRPEMPHADRRMSRRGSRSDRLAARRTEYAVKLLLMGTALVVGPWFLQGTQFGKVFGSLWPIGLLLIGAGALLLWVGRLNAEPGRDKGSRQNARPEPKGVIVEPVPSGAVDTASAARVLRAAPRETWGYEVFAEMVDWRRFEAVVERLFGQAGFDTKSQSHGADGGVDIWLFSRSQPGAPVSIVQCKHWSGRRVGVDKVRELRGVMASNGIKRGQFATTSSFSDDAIEFARGNGINLLDVDALMQLIGQRTPAQQLELLQIAYEGEYWLPTCVNCGVKLTQRTPKSGGRPFWGCINYPRCKTTMPMRA